MTTPRDDIGLSERLRISLARVAQEESGGDNLAILLASYFEPGIEDEELDDSGTWKQGALNASDRVLDAIHAHYATQLDAQAARVKELEKAIAHECFIEQCGEIGYVGIRDYSAMQARALRAERERDEAYERAAKAALLAIRQYKEQQEHAHSDGDEGAGYKESGSFFSTDKNLPSFVAAAIRHLAAGDEEGK